MKVEESISDCQLIKQYIAGSEVSFRLLINRHKKRVFSYIYLIVKDKELANDLFQDTFVKVINVLKSGNYNEEGKFIQWVIRIAHNLSIDYFRKSKRLPTIDNNFEDFDILDLLHSFDKSIEDKMIFNQVCEDIRKIIKSLPSEQREVLIMRYYNNMSYNEIAEQTNVSINTALGRMRYALINMRKIVKDKNIYLIA